MTQDQWRYYEEGRGVRTARGLFCCPGCAKDGRCTCLEELTAEVLLEDDVKGPAEEPSEMSHPGKAPLPPGQVGHGSGTTGTVPRVHHPPSDAPAS
jgi:hypothetical protein